jgi:hypothetical protein
MVGMLHVRLGDIIDWNKTQRRLWRARWETESLYISSPQLFRAAIKSSFDTIQHKLPNRTNRRHQRKDSRIYAAM